MRDRDTRLRIDYNKNPKPNLLFEVRKHKNTPCEVLRDSILGAMVIKTGALGRMGGPERAINMNGQVGVNTNLTAMSEDEDKSSLLMSGMPQQHVW